RHTSFSRDWSSDVCSSDLIWFTDPPFGIVGYYQGERAEQEMPAHVYRLDPDTLELAIVADSVNGPNGLAFSPDESKLYVVESREIGRAARREGVVMGGAGV